MTKHHGNTMLAKVVEIGKSLYVVLAPTFCRRLRKRTVHTRLRTEEWVGIACRIGLSPDDGAGQVGLQEVCNLDVCSKCTIQLMTLTLTLVIVVGSNRVVVVVEWTVDT